MAAIFERGVGAAATATAAAALELRRGGGGRRTKASKPAWVTLTFFAILVAVLLVGLPP